MVALWMALTGRAYYKILKREGYSVSIVQNPTKSLEDDVAVTKRTLATQDGPTILVGHSHGGAVITEAGNHPKVSALVYIAAFAPDKGESVGSLIQDPPPGAPVPPNCHHACDAVVTGACRNTTSTRVISGNPYRRVISKTPRYSQKCGWWRVVPHAA
jgi:pimeloyl-ACP methyl ester carboxylesterase